MEGHKEHTEKPIGGRPTKYRKEYTRYAYQLGLLGATDEQVSEAFDITVSTLYLWKNKYRGFSEALRRGKIQADAIVATALFKRAKGFTYNEVTFEKIDGKEILEITSDALITTEPYRKKIVTKYLPPDAGAAMSWLKNRQKELWRDRQELGIEFQQMTDQQLDKVIDKMTQAALNKATNGK